MKNKRTKKLFNKLYKTVAQNLSRRVLIVDDKLNYNKNVPIPSWVELSIIDVCNRSCIFCPKSDSSIAPNTFQQMEMSLINKLCKNLESMNFKGTVTLCGYGEPLLHKNINNIVNSLSKVSYVEIVTNGDVISSKKIKELYDNNANKVLISMYDGPEQLEKFKIIIEESKVPKEFVILRDRWFDAKKDYGIKLTNRTGTISIGNQPKIGEYKKCFYPSYQFLIDWNGDIFLCPQDWQRRVTMGNMMQTELFDIWTGKILTKYRKKLLLGERDLEPCKNCNAEGTLLGKNHSAAWSNYYSKN